MALMEPKLPEYVGQRCDKCQCPIEVGLFISKQFRKVCRVCWDLWHNTRFNESSYWDNI